MNVLSAKILHDTVHEIVLHRVLYNSRNHVSASLLKCSAVALTAVLFMHA